MPESVAIIGAGVSGLTCGIVFAGRGYRTAIFAEEVGQQTTSGAAAAVWFPYDAEPLEKVVPWALATYNALVDLSRDPSAGVSMIELRQFSRTKEIQIPDWAMPLGARRLSVATGLWPVRDRAQRSGDNFKSGFSLRVP
ncbi:MAG: FAD-dependent oxidoreductase, partial [Candidatus Udaeobacter sp.]